MRLFVCLMTAGLFWASQGWADLVPATQPTTQPVKKPWVEAPIPRTPGDHKLKYRTEIDGKTIDLAYLLHLPEDYGKTNERHPLLMFLHVSGEAGNDLAGIYVHGPEKLLTPDNPDAMFRKTCPLIVLSPQCPAHGERWDQDVIVKATVKLLDHIIDKMHADPDRVYCTGLSMGGTGTWHVALEAPDRFAAIAPISAASYLPDDVTKKLKYVAVWATSGVNDQDAVNQTKVMTDALKDSRVEVRHTVVLNQDHGVWGCVYENAQFYEWLLSKRRPSAIDRQRLDNQFEQSRKSPVADAPLPTAPGHHLITIETKIADQQMRMYYLLYIPKSYSPHGTKSPMLVFLHDGDSMGTDIKDQCMHGPDVELERNPQISQSFPFVVVSPMLPLHSLWDQPPIAETVNAIVDEVSKKLNVDPARISITGLNSGGTAAWNAALAAPNRYAALAPVIQEGGFTPDPGPAAALQNVATCVAIGQGENGSVDRLKAIFATFHAQWRILPITPQQQPNWRFIYSNPDFYTWLQQQHTRGKS